MSVYSLCLAHFWFPAIVVNEREKEKENEKRKKAKSLCSMREMR
jgi:hypothetical protein